MTTENQKTLKPLVNILRFYGWVKVLRLPGKNMLVADPEFITELRSQVGDLTCEFSVPSQAIDDIKARSKKNNRSFKVVRSCFGETFANRISKPPGVFNSL